MHIGLIQEAFKKKRAGHLGTETSTYMSEVLALALVPLRHKRKDIESTSLSFQSIDYILSSDGLPLGMLGVCHSISDIIFQEHLKDPSGLFIDEA